MLILTKEGKLQEGIEISANEQEIFNELQDIMKEYPFNIYSSNATKLTAMLIEKYKMYKRATEPEPESLAEYDFSDITTED